MRSYLSLFLKVGQPVGARSAAPELYPSTSSPPHWPPFSFEQPCGVNSRHLGVFRSGQRHKFVLACAIFSRSDRSDLAEAVSAAFCQPGGVALRPEPIPKAGGRKWLSISGLKVGLFTEGGVIEDILQRRQDGKRDDPLRLLSTLELNARDQPIALMRGDRARWRPSALFQARGATPWLGAASFRPGGGAQRRERPALSRCKSPRSHLRCVRRLRQD